MNLLNLKTANFFMNFFYIKNVKFMDVSRFEEKRDMEKRNIINKIT